MCSCVCVCVCVQCMCVHIYVGAKGPSFFSPFIVFPLLCTASCTVLMRDKPGGLTRFHLKHGLSPNSCRLHPPHAASQALEEVTRGSRNHPSLSHFWKERVRVQEPGCVHTRKTTLYTNPDVVLGMTLCWCPDGRWKWSRLIASNSRNSERCYFHLSEFLLMPPRAVIS